MLPKSRRLYGTNEAVHLGQVRWRPSNGTAYLAGEVPAPPIGGQVSARLRAGGRVQYLSSAPTDPRATIFAPRLLARAEQPQAALASTTTNSFAVRSDYSRPSLELTTLLSLKITSYSNLSTD